MKEDNNTTLKSMTPKMISGNRPGFIAFPEISIKQQGKSSICILRYVTKRTLADSLKAIEDPETLHYNMNFIKGRIMTGIRPKPLKHETQSWQ